MTLDEKVHYVATVTVKRITKTVATVANSQRYQPQVKEETGRTEATVVNLALSDEDLNRVLELVIQHLQLHQTP